MQDSFSKAVLRKKELQKSAKSLFGHCSKYLLWREFGQ